MNAEQPASQEENQFGEATAAANNSSVSTEASANNTAGSGAVENTAAAENVAAEENVAEAPANNSAQNNSAEAPANNSAEAPANNSAEQPANVAGEGELAAKLNATPAPAAASKKGLSAAAQSVLDDRMKTLADLKAAYAAAFGDNPKAPKAKSYEAFALHKIRKEQGEEAFQAKMKEFVERNQGKFAGEPVKKPRTKKVKFNNTAAANVKVSSASPAKNANSRALIMESVRTMGSTAKGLIDSMVSTVAALAKTNTGDMSAVAAKANSAANSAKPKKSGTRKPRSNKGKTHKKHNATPYKPFVNE
jgi:hypothetical protein